LETVLVSFQGGLQSEVAGHQELVDCETRGFRHPDKDRHVADNHGIHRLFQQAIHEWQGLRIGAQPGDFDGIVQVGPHGGGHQIDAPIGPRKFCSWWP